jgi:hypothetical protein
VAVQAAAAQLALARRHLVLPGGQLGLLLAQRRLGGLQLLGALREGLWQGGARQVSAGRSRQRSAALIVGLCRAAGGHPVQRPAPGSGLALAPGPRPHTCCTHLLLRRKRVLQRRQPLPHHRQLGLLLGHLLLRATHLLLPVRQRLLLRCLRCLLLRDLGMPSLQLIRNALPVTPAAAAAAAAAAERAQGN